jgi:uncharacterized protein (TIGR00369 family)
LDNPIGLHLDQFVVTDDGLTADFIPRDEYRGFADVLHGGVLAALLDETMAWTAMLLEGTFVITANLEIKFRKPAPTASSYTVHGRVTERRGRRLRLQASALVDDQVVAEGNGLFLATDPVNP